MSSSLNKDIIIIIIIIIAKRYNCVRIWAMMKTQNVRFGIAGMNRFLLRKRGLTPLRHVYLLYVTYSMGDDENPKCNIRYSRYEQVFVTETRLNAITS